MDYFKFIVNDSYSRIECQMVPTNNFWLKPSLINMAQQG